MGNARERTEKETKLYDCPVEAALDVLGGKWGLPIVAQLARGTQRYGELKRSLPSISEKMLIRQLRRLEADGIVRRKQYPEVPPRVEYSLSEVGASLLPVLTQLGAWAVKHLPDRLSFLRSDRKDA
jgi:DNA-binding HxlR family transcriptional regulator